jgi:uncharacterized membrane protein YkvA (DUF1232 family)
MSKAKVKPSDRKQTRTAPKQRETQVPYQKAAIRSRAFAKAILDASSFAADSESLRALFEQAARKAAVIPKESFKDSWPYLQAMLRLIRAYFRGEYRNISRNALLTIIAAVSYLVDPFDLIPDEIPFLGFLDDATVIAFAVARTRQTLDDFMTWETTSL